MSSVDSDSDGSDSFDESDDDIEQNSESERAKSPDSIRKWIGINSLEIKKYEKSDFSTAAFMTGNMSIISWIIDTTNHVFKCPF